MKTTIRDKVEAVLGVCCLGLGITLQAYTGNVQDPFFGDSLIPSKEEQQQAVQQRLTELAERKKLAQIREEKAETAENAILKGVPEIGTLGPCQNSWWVNTQSSLHRLVEVCHELYNQNSPAARALGVPSLRLQTCTTQLWYKQHRNMLNLWSILYHNGDNWPWERDAWRSCTDGNFDRLKGW